MSTHSKIIQPPEAIYAALEDAAVRERKPLNELGAELIMQGPQRRGTSLEELMEYGHAKGKSTHPGLNEQAVVDIVHGRRRARTRS